MTSFVRSKTGLTLKQAALDPGEPANPMGIAANRFARTAAAEAGAAAGVVRIASSEVIGVEVLPSIFAALRHEHAGLILEFGLGNRREELLNREADIAVRLTRPTQSALIAKRVGAVRLGFFAHQKYLDATGIAPAILAQLKSRALIGFETEQDSARFI